MAKWKAHARAEVEMSYEFETDDEGSGDAAVVMGDKMRALMPPLPDGLRWSIWSMEIERVFGPES